MFIGPRIEPPAEGIPDIRIPFRRLLKASWGEGRFSSMQESLSRWLVEDDVVATGEILDPQIANERYAIGKLKFTKPVDEGIAIARHERERRRMLREFYLREGVPGGFFSGRGLASFSTSVIAGILNPLDFAVNFVPLVGWARYAETLRKAKVAAWRVRLARGLLTTEEALAARMPKFLVPVTRGVLEGGLGGFIGQVPFAFAEWKDERKYGLAEFTQGALISAAFGAAVNIGVHGAARIWRKLHPSTRAAMARTAMEKFLRDEPIRVDHIARLDQKQIREELRMRLREEWIRTHPEEVDKAFKAAQKTIRDMYAKEIVAVAYRTLKKGEVVSGGKLHVDLLGKEEKADVTGGKSAVTGLPLTAPADKAKKIALDPNAALNDPELRHHAADIVETAEYKGLISKEDKLEFTDVQLVKRLYDDDLLIESGFLTDKNEFVSREEVKLSKGYITAEELFESSEAKALRDVEYQALIEKGEPPDKALEQVKAKIEQRRIEKFFEDPDIQKKVLAERERRIDEAFARERAGLEEELKELERENAELEKMAPKEAETDVWSGKRLDKLTEEIERDVKALKEKLKDMGEEVKLMEEEVKVMEGAPEVKKEGALEVKEKAPEAKKKIAPTPKEGKLTESSIYEALKKAAKVSEEGKARLEALRAAARCLGRRL